MDMTNAVVAIFLTGLVLVYWENLKDKCRFLFLAVRGFAMKGARLSYLENKIEALEYDKAQLERENKALAKQSITDDLTGLPNRGCFEQKFVELRSRLHSSGTLRKDSANSINLLLLDVDKFKLVNDTYGHLAGDQVLKKVAEVIRGCFRLGDVCRWGGEEFAALLPNVTHEFAHDLADKVRQAVESAEITTADGIRVKVTISIGVAYASSFAGAEHLFEVADKALYQAKKTGRNRVVSAETK